MAPALSPRSPPWPLWSWGGSRARLCPSGGQKGWQRGSAGGEGRGRKAPCRDPKHRASHASAAGGTGQAQPAPQHPPSSPIPLRSRASGKEPMCLPALPPPQSNRLFQCVLRHHVRLMDPHGPLFCCCLIINHLNGDVNSRSDLHPRPHRESSVPFTHRRSKMGYLANKPGQSERA